MNVFTAFHAWTLVRCHNEKSCRFFFFLFPDSTMENFHGRHVLGLHAVTYTYIITYSSKENILFLRSLMHSMLHGFRIEDPQDNEFCLGATRGKLSSRSNHNWVSLDIPIHPKVNIVQSLQKQQLIY